MIRVPTARLLAGLTLVAAVAAASAALATSPLTAQSGAFGHAVVIDGDEILIAEPTTSFRPGAVYVYRESGGTWREASMLRAPDSERADGFGTLLARTGNTLFVGQRGGPLHVFERGAGGAWAAAGMIDDEEIAGQSPECRFDGLCGTDFGLSLAADGDWLLVGVPGTAQAPRGRPASRRKPRPKAPSTHTSATHPATGCSAASSSPATARAVTGSARRSS